MDFETIECPGRQALTELRRLREEYPSSGLYPFLIGPEANYRLLEESDDDDRTLEEIGAASEKIDIPEWLAKYDNPEKMVGEWPMGTRPDDISLHRDYEGRFREVVIIGLAEIEESWMLPAVTRFGSFNSCQDASFHCAMMRHWAPTYRMEIIGLSHDTIECRVNAPPLTRASALQLAWEQCHYCPDIVAQGTETVAALAASLLSSHYWYFWWD